MATVAASKLTADEFLAMDLGEGRHELVRGEIVEVPPAQFEHGYICGLAYGLLQGFGRGTGHGFAATNDSAVVVSATFISSWRRVPAS